MKKFMLALIFVLCTMVGLMIESPTYAATSGDYTYSVSNGKATITDFNTSTNVDVVIPSTLGGYPVTNIGDHAFENCTSLTSVTLPEGLTEIGDYAFDNCTSLVSITFSKGLTSIGNYAFVDCTSLISITLPDGVISIGSAAFNYCLSLTSITLPESLTSIGDGAFCNCKGLDEINWNAINVSDFLYDDDIFANAGINGDGINVVFGDKVERIPAYIFFVNNYNFANPKIINVKIHGSVTNIGSDAFSGCASLTSITLPDGLTSIGSRAFYRCTSLASIILPESLTSIGSLAFKNCKGLEEINWNAINVSDFTDSEVFSGAGINGDGINVVFGEKVEKIPFCLFGSTKSFYVSPKITSVKIYGNNVSIDYGAFIECTTLASIEIQGNVTSIGNYVFSGCTSLTSIEIQGSVTSIGDYAFSDCISLTSITIPNSVRTIGKDVLFNCSNLKEISIPFIGASRTAGGATNGVFGYLFGKSNVGEYIVANQYYSVFDCVKYNIPTSLEKVYITDAIQIPYGSFDGCSGINHIELNEGVTQISQLAFANCDYLSVRIPKTLTRIGTDAFKLTNVKKLYVSTDSYGHTYAIDNGYTYELYDSLSVTGISLDKTVLDIVEGNTYVLKANISPANATYKNVTWESSDENVATVSADGTVTAVSRGEATITATTEEGGFKATCKVNVLRAVTSVSLNYTELHIGVGHSKTLVPTVIPASASDKSVTWKSSDTNVATVTNGIVTAVGYGTATITVTTNDGGFTAECVITTTVPVTSVSLNKQSANMYVDDTLSLLATVLPSNAYDKSIIWTSSDESVATVSNGTVTAISAGTATITATTVDGGHTASCAVTVTAISTDEPVDKDAPQIVLSNIKTTAGNTVTVDVSIANNPGFVSLSLEIGYNSEYFTLTNIQPEPTVGATFSPAQSYTKNPYNFGWVSASNTYYEGKLATLTFTVDENTPDGIYPLTVSYYKGAKGNYTDGYDINYDQDYVALGLAYVNGNIVVISYTPGDVNGDDRINDRDATTLLRYLAGWDLTDYVEAALDIDGSGTINDRDATTLLRYLAGWDIELR